MKIDDAAGLLNCYGQWGQNTQHTIANDWETICRHSR